MHTMRTHRDAMTQHAQRTGKIKREEKRKMNAKQKAMIRAISREFGGGAYGERIIAERETGESVSAVRVESHDGPRCRRSQCTASTPASLVCFSGHS